MNVAVAQSGGPTSAINASLLGVFTEGLKVKTVEHVFGSVNGIEGIINDNLVDLNSVIKTNYDMELIRQTPSTVLGSCRYKLPDYKEDESVYIKITDNLNRHGIGAFLYIGGNDSMDTVAKLSAYYKEKKIDISVIGIPKTIDNDLEITDHTPGFGSAAKYVATSLQEIVRDSIVYSIDSVTVVEIMGRHAGWLTASTCILHALGDSAPHLIYLPESKITKAKLISDVKKMRQVHKAVIIAVSEGLKLDISNSEKGYGSNAVDSFGHEYLSGIGKVIENIIREEIGCKVRSVELNVMQRCSAHIASLTDIEEAESIGAAAVREAVKGVTGKVMVFRRVSNSPYTVVTETADAKDVANKERFFPRNLINEDENNVKDEAISYFLPLIQGERVLKMDRGLPLHFYIK